MNTKNVTNTLPSKKKWAEAIKELQYDKGVTNIELAKLLGVTKMTVGNIRNGRSSYERMAKALETLEQLKRK
jgi:transcriptional regulator with XRE-family HTH domain